MPRKEVFSCYIVSCFSPFFSSVSRSRSHLSRPSWNNLGKMPVVASHAQRPDVIMHVVIFKARPARPDFQSQHCLYWLDVVIRSPRPVSPSSRAFTYCQVMKLNPTQPPVLSDPTPTITIEFQLFYFVSLIPWAYYKTVGLIVARSIRMRNKRV